MCFEKIQKWQGGRRPPHKYAIVLPLLINVALTSAVLLWIAIPCWHLSLGRRRMKREFLFFLKGSVLILLTL